ncbi:MAG: hypothetical protein K1X54_07185 [Flavobacteriales bacterium]|nr:hypothetical protein [Flavobacteriales bacterium]
MELDYAKTKKKIRTGAIIIMAGSGYLILSNSFGAIAWDSLEVQKIFQNNRIPIQGLDMLMNYYIEICMTLATMGLLFLIGGFFLYRLQAWATKWLTVIACISLIGAIAMTCWVGQMISEIVHPMIAVIIMIISSSFELAPLIFMIWFLNRKSIQLVLKDKPGLT